MRRFDAIGIKDLYLQGMVQNRHRSRAIADMGLHEFRRQPAAERRQATVVVADRFLPSSKLCSAGSVIQDDLPLSVRPWTSPACSATHDQDLNAAKAGVQGDFEHVVSTLAGIRGVLDLPQKGAGERKGLRIRLSRRSSEQQKLLDLLQLRPAPQHLESKQVIQLTPAVGLFISAVVRRSLG